MFQRCGNGMRVRIARQGFGPMKDYLDNAPSVSDNAPSVFDNTPPVVETVVKIGGEAFRRRDILDPIAETLATAARERRILVVPGGGAFADRVRDVDREFCLSATAAHWMAVRAMDQAAFLLADVIPRGVVAAAFETIRAAMFAGRVPVLAPSACLMEVDPLPHSWEVTSDSIAAWVAGRLGARRLVLVKPPGVEVTRSPRPAPASVDSYFDRALPEHLHWTVTPVDDPTAFAAALMESGPS
jgi:dihydroneopterin aldolase